MPSICLSVIKFCQTTCYELFHKNNRYIIKFCWILIVKHLVLLNKKLLCPKIATVLKYFAFRLNIRILCSMTLKLLFIFFIYLHCVVVIAFIGIPVSWLGMYLWLKVQLRRCFEGLIWHWFSVFLIWQACLDFYLILNLSSTKKVWSYTLFLFRKLKAFNEKYLGNNYI